MTWSLKCTSRGGGPTKRAQRRGGVGPQRPELCTSSPHRRCRITSKPPVPRFELPFTAMLQAHPVIGLLHQSTSHVQNIKSVHFIDRQAKVIHQVGAPSSTTSHVDTIQSVHFRWSTSECTSSRQPKSSGGKPHKPHPRKFPNALPVWGVKGKSKFTAAEV